MTGPFVSSTGGVSLHLRPEEVVLLRGVPLIVGTVGSRSDDPAISRLDPDPYPDDRASNDEYHRLVGGDLRTARSDDRAIYSATLRAEGLLTIAEAEAWMRVIGDARLTIAARKGIVDDGWEAQADDDPQLGLLLYLGYLQDALVVALLPDVVTD